MRSRSGSALHRTPPPPDPPPSGQGLRHGRASWAAAARVAAPVVAALAAAATLWVWLRPAPDPRVRERLPGTDRPPGGEPPAPARVHDRGERTEGAGVPSLQSGAWPAFRGADRSGISRDPTPLADAWPPAGPPVRWAIPLGEGHAGAAVWEGRVFVLDYDRGRQRDAVRCLSLDDGREIWRYSYPVRIKRNHGMSRTVPAVSGGRVVTLGPKCHVTCLDAKTGTLRWGVDLVREYGATVPPWYAGQCPLIEEDRAILALGGDALLVSFDCANGQPVWQSPNPRAWTMTHSSIMPTDLGGVRTYVYCGSGGVAGIRAGDGALLWSTDAWKISIATIPTPVPLGGDRLLLAGGYNSGAAVLRVTRRGDTFLAEVLYRLPAGVFGADMQTPVLREGFVYGIRPGGELVCMDPAEGTIRWSSGPAHRFGLGPFTAADGKLYVMDDAGQLTMARLTPTGFKPLASTRILAGPDAWGPMAVAGGRLIARDLTRMVCVDIGRDAR